jgi:hypothetical protein
MTIVILSFGVHRSIGSGNIGCSILKVVKYFASAEREKREKEALIPLFGIQKI